MNGATRKPRTRKLRAMSSDRSTRMQAVREHVGNVTPIEIRPVQGRQEHTIGEYINPAERVYDLVFPSHRASCNRPCRRCLPNAKAVPPPLTPSRRDFYHSRALGCTWTPLLLIKQPYLLRAASLARRLDQLQLEPDFQQRQWHVAVGAGACIAGWLSVLCASSRRMVDMLRYGERKPRAA
jgi:hypothetical protein